MPNTCKVVSIGHTILGRPIWMIIISNDVKKTIKRDTVLIDAAIHAREWISVTTALYIIENLVKNKNLLKTMDFLVIPCINPDGYEYTHTLVILKKITNKFR